MPTPLPAGRSAPAPSLGGLLDGVLPDPNTDYGVVVEDLASGARMAVNESDVFPPASLYKLSVAWLAMRRVDAGSLSLRGAADHRGRGHGRARAGRGYRGG